MSYMNLWEFCMCLFCMCIFCMSYMKLQKFCLCLFCIHKNFRLSISCVIHESKRILYVFILHVNFHTSHMYLVSTRSCMHKFCMSFMNLQEFWCVMCLFCMSYFMYPQEVVYVYMYLQIFLCIYFVCSMCIYKNYVSEFCIYFYHWTSHMHPLEVWTNLFQMVSKTWTYGFGPFSIIFELVID